MFNLNRFANTNYLVALSIVLIAVFPARTTAQDETDASVLWIASAPMQGDLDEMVDNRLVRVLVPYSLGWFFFVEGRAMGVEAELIRMLQERLNKAFKTGSREITVVAIPTARDNLIPYLKEGKGDIAAGNLTITDDRLAEVDFTTPWATGLSEVLVTGPAAPEISGIDDLAGMEISVRTSSSYYQSLLKLNSSFEERGLDPVVIEPLSDILQDSDLIEMVDAGLLPFAVVDLHKARFWDGVFDDITVRDDIVFRDNLSIAWAIRKNAPELRAFVDEFVAENKKGSMIGNILIKRYLKNTDWLHDSLAKEDQQHLLQLRKYFIQYGDEYGFDWLMIAAQAFQESKFDQSLVSHAGAVGIMQLLPTTAADPNVGIPDINSVETNIHAGVKYLRFLREQYFDEPEISELDRVYFSWAAYNAGPGNVRKFRRVAEERGLDPNVWFGQTEIAAAEIIGRETVQYVRNIYKYYIAYTLSKRYKDAKAQAQENTDG